MIYFILCHKSKIQTSSFRGYVDMFKCPSALHSIVYRRLQQLQMEANIHPTEIALGGINEAAASKNTAWATNTWMAAWAEWCKARKIKCKQRVISIA